MDAALLFIIAVYEYYERTQDAVLVKSAYQTMAEIIDWYVKGTDFGIKMDEDGLIMAGQDYLDGREGGGYSAHAQARKTGGGQRILVQRPVHYG